MSDPGSTWSTRHASKVTPSSSSLPKTRSIEYFTDDAPHWGSASSAAYSASASLGAGPGDALGSRGQWPRESREVSATHQFSPLLVGADQLELPDSLRRVPDASAAPVAEPSTEKRRLPFVVGEDGEGSSPSAVVSKYQCESLGGAAPSVDHFRRPPPLDHRLTMSALSPLHHEDLLSTPIGQQHEQRMQEQPPPQQYSLRLQFPRTATATTPLMGPSPLECTTPGACDDFHRQSALPRTSRSNSEQPSFRHNEDGDRRRVSEASWRDGTRNDGQNDEGERVGVDSAVGFVSILQAQRGATADNSTGGGRGKPSGSDSARESAGDDDAATYFVSCMTPLCVEGGPALQTAAGTSAMSAFPSGGGRGGVVCDSTRTPATPLATGISPSNSPYPQDGSSQAHPDHSQLRFGGSISTTSGHVAVPPLGSLGHLRSAGGAPTGFGVRGPSATTAPVPATPTKPRPPSRVVTPQRFVTPRPSAATTPRPALEANDNPFSQYRGHQAEVAMAELHISALVDQTESRLMVREDATTAATATGSSSTALESSFAMPLFDAQLPRNEVSDSDSSVGAPGGGGGGGLVLARTPRHVPPHAQVAVHNQMRYHHSRQLTPQNTPTSQNAGMFPGSHVSAGERTPSTAAHQSSYPHHSHHHHHHATTSSARHSRVNSSCAQDCSPPPALRPPLHPSDESFVSGGGERNSSRALFEFSPLVGEGGDESPSMESSSTIRTPNTFSNTASATRPFPPPQQAMPRGSADLDGGFLRRAPLFRDDDDDDPFSLSRASAAPPCSSLSTETLPPQPQYHPLPTLLFGDDDEETAAAKPIFLPTELGYDEVEPGDRFRAARFSFLHRDPSSRGGSSQVVVPLHVDVNGTVWLARHYVDGLPYAVKEIASAANDRNPHNSPSSSSSSTSSSVSVELQALTIGNSHRSIVEVRAAQHMVRYHTTFVHKPTGVQVIQCEYLPRGNLAEALELHWASATQRIRQVLHAGKVSTDDDKARLLRWFIKEVLPEPSEIITCLTHVLMALDALHQHGMVHGNPIPWNVFLVTNYHYKLGNFGGAARVGSGKENVQLPATSTTAQQQAKGNSNVEAAGLGWYPVVGEVERFLPPYPVRGTMTPEQLDVYVFARSTMVLLWSQIRRAATHWNECFGLSHIPVSGVSLEPPTSSSSQSPPPPLSMPQEASLEALRASGPQGSGWHLYDDRVLACFESMLCATSASALLSDRVEGGNGRSMTSPFFSSTVVSPPTTLLHPLNPVTFHLQTAYDREIMNMLTTLEHLKQRREQLQRKVKRHALPKKERMAAGNVDEEGQLVRGASVLSLDNGEPLVKKSRTGFEEVMGGGGNDNEDEGERLPRLPICSEMLDGDEEPTSPLPINVTDRVYRGRHAVATVLDESQLSDDPSLSPTSTFFASSSVDSTPTVSPKHADGPHFGSGENTPRQSLLPPPVWHSMLPRPSRGILYTSGSNSNPAPRPELFVSGSIPRRGHAVPSSSGALDDPRWLGSKHWEPAAAQGPPHPQEPPRPPPAPPLQRSLADMFDEMAPLVVGPSGTPSATVAHVSWLHTSSASLCSSGDLESGAANRRRGPPKTLRTKPRNGYAHGSSLANTMPPPPSPPHAPATHHVPLHPRPFQQRQQQHGCPHGMASVSVLPSTTVSAMLAYFHAHLPVGSGSASESSLMPLTADTELGCA